MNLYLKRTLIGFLIFISPFIFLYLSLFFNWFGERPELGTIDDSSAPYFSSQQSKALEQEKVILFGDLHVHTTYSLDAFLGSLPILAALLVINAVRHDFSFRSYEVTRKVLHTHLIYIGLDRKRYRHNIRSVRDLYRSKLL